MSDELVLVDPYDGLFFFPSSYPSSDMMSGSECVKDEKQRVLFDCQNTSG